MNLLLQDEGTLQQLDNTGRSALSWAAGSGQGNITELLLNEREIQADEEDVHGRTPLSWAAGGGYVKTIDLLLTQEGVNARSTDYGGRSPLAWAAGNGHVDAIRNLLRAKGADGQHILSIQDESDPDNSSVTWAAKNGQENTLRILVEEGLRLPEKPEQHRRLPWAHFYLHKAAEQGWVILAKLLIEKNALVDPRDPDYDDRTPLCVAAEKGQLEMVRILLKAGAACNYQTVKAIETPLGLAIRFGHEGAVKILLSAGANIKLENAKGEAPMDLAKHHPTIFHMVAAVDKDGRLAEAEDPHLHSSVDHEFKATVIDFVSVSGVHTPCAAEIDVDELLKNPLVSTIPDAASTSFRWLHLPANNVSLASGFLVSWADSS